MKKITSVVARKSRDDIEGLSPEINLDSAIEKLKKLIYDPKIENEEVAVEMTFILGLIQAAKDALSAPRSRSSSRNSVASLGDKIADYDKALIYTYCWGNAIWTSIEERKGDFQKWLEGGLKLPPKSSTLNCWESVIVILYLYNAIDKNELLNAIVTGRKTTANDDGTWTVQQSEPDIIGDFLGLWGTAYRVDSIDDVKPGDIVSFSDINGIDMAHVAITFEEVPSIRLASFWLIPEEKMILVSPDKLLSVCTQAASRSDQFEEINLANIRISNKFRDFFQRLAAE